MRIAFYSIPPVKIGNRPKRISEYLKSELERVYSDALKSGVVNRDLYEIYLSAIESLESGKLTEFRKVFERMKDLIEKEKGKAQRFEYTPPCFDCAIVSFSESEVILKILKFSPKDKQKYFYKVFFVYDPYGDLKATGGIVRLDAIERAFEETFMAVA
jgi:hypothetical protein